MTNNEIFTAFENIIGDNLDRTLEVQLANMAKNKLEAVLKLEVTKKLDTSKTSTVGGTYTTSYNLPSDILEPLGYLYVGTAKRIGIPLGEREAFKSSPQYFYVDLANSRFYLTGTVGTAETITIPYIYKTTDIADDTATVIVWPSHFHMLIPIEMAKIWPAIDQSGREWSYAAEWDALYRELKNAIIDWDHSWKLNAIGHATPYGDQDAPGENRINL